MSYDKGFMKNFDRARYGERKQSTIKSDSLLLWTCSLTLRGSSRTESSWMSSRISWFLRPSDGKRTGPTENRTRSPWLQIRCFTIRLWALSELSSRWFLNPFCFIRNPHNLHWRLLIGYSTMKMGKDMQNEYFWLFLYDINLVEGRRLQKCKSWRAENKVQPITE